VSVCHCLDCQRRSGSTFAVQARWPDGQVQLAGAFSEWSTTGESGALATFRFCATCGSTVVYASAGMPGLTAVAVGAFADPSFPPPEYSVYEERKHPWIVLIGDAMDHFD
jgi:hypothetical protein